MGKAIIKVFNSPVFLNSFLLEGKKKKAPQFVIPIITSLDREGNLTVREGNNLAVPGTSDKAVYKTASLKQKPLDQIKHAARAALQNHLMCMAVP